METYDRQDLSKYTFHYTDGERNISYAFPVPDESTPTDVYEQFAQFLNAVYGWDVRKHLYENITT